MKQRFTFLFVAAVLLLSTPAYCSYTGGQCGPSVHYLIDTDAGTLTLTGTGATYDYSGWGLNEYCAPWNSIAINIRHVIVSEGITRIGNWLFGGHNLYETHYTLPSSLTSIGSNAFYGINGLLVRNNLRERQRHRWRRFPRRQHGSSNY